MKDCLDADGGGQGFQISSQPVSRVGDFPQKGGDAVGTMDSVNGAPQESIGALRWASFSEPALSL